MKKRFSGLFSKKDESSGSTTVAAAPKKTKKGKKGKEAPLVDDEYIKNQVELDAYESSNILTRELKTLQTRNDYNVNDSSIVFSISNILSLEECIDYINKSEKMGFKSVDWEYDKEYRDCNRVVCQSNELSNILWNRIKHHLTRNDIENVRPFGFDNSGVWIPFCINPCMRFTKYGKGHHFRPHKDGGFVWNEEQRSVYTLMIYLNEYNDNDNNNNDEMKYDKTSVIDPIEYHTSESDENDKNDKTGKQSKKKKKNRNGNENESEEKKETFKIIKKIPQFKGGLTKFYESNENDKNTLSDKTIANGNCQTVKPKLGTGVIFNHDVWHEGCKVESGFKYILRTDIVFRRVEHALNSDEILKNPLFYECEKLYQKSISLQKDGDPKGSTVAYLDALRIQAKLSSIDPKKQKALKASRTKDGFGKEIDLLPTDIYGKIFSYLGLSEIIGCCSVSKAYHYLVKSQSIWKNLYYQTWPELVEYETNATNDEPTLLTPWYHLFKYRYKADSEFHALCVNMSSDHVEFDLGFRATLHQREYEYSQRGKRFTDFWTSFLKWDKQDLFESKGPIPAVFSWVAGHYWHCRSGRENAECGIRCLGDSNRYRQHTLLRWLLSDYGMLDEDCFRNMLKYIFADGLEQWQQPEEYSLLLTLPYWFDEIDWANYVLYVIFDLLNIAYLSIQSPAKMSLIGITNMDSGIVVNMEPRCLAIVCCVNGKEDWKSKVVLKQYQTRENMDKYPDSIPENEEAYKLKKEDEYVGDDSDARYQRMMARYDANTADDFFSEEYYQSHWWSKTELHRMITKGGVFGPKKALGPNTLKAITLWKHKKPKIEDFMNHELNGIVFKNTPLWNQRRQFQKDKFLAFDKFDSQVLSKIFTKEMRKDRFKLNGYKSMTKEIEASDKLLTSTDNKEKKEEATPATAAASNNESKSDSGDYEIPVGTWKGLSNPLWRPMDLLCNLYNVMINCQLTKEKGESNEDDKEINIALVGPCCKDFEIIISYFVNKFMEIDNSGIKYNVICDDLKENYRMAKEQVDKEKPPNYQAPTKTWNMEDSDLKKMVRIPNISKQRSGLLIGSLKYSQGFQVIRNREFKDKTGTKIPAKISKIVDRQFAEY